MDALAGYESDDGDNAETTSSNLKKVETNVENTHNEPQDRKNGEERSKSKKQMAVNVDDRVSKTTPSKYEKRELDCTVKAEITTREAENEQNIEKQGNTKTSAEEGKEKRHRSRSRSKSGHRSSRSRSRSVEKSYRKGRRSRSREHSRSPRSRSHSRSPSHRTQKHSRHSGEKRSSRTADSRKSRSDSHRRKRRSRSRSRSRDRNRRRSRSRSHERSERSRRKSRSRSRSRHYRRSRSRDRSSRFRSRSRERKRHEGRNAKESNEGASGGGAGSAVKKNEEQAPETSSKLPLKTATGTISQMTPQLAVQQAMAAVNAKAQQLTGISLPKYYNPAAVNPMKYAEQMQKRKLLWNCNKDKPQVIEQPEVIQTTSNNNWEKTTFAQDLDGKMTAKFRKLMGIKGAAEEKEPVDEKAVSEEQMRKQEEMFRKLDQQYEAARMSTHTHRGVGLGFTSQTHHLFPK